MVAAVRRGMSIRKAAKMFGVAKSTVQVWVKLTAGKRLDRVDFSDRPSGVRDAVNRVGANVETCVLAIRKQLHETDDLGEFGPDAILHEMEELDCTYLPSRATIHRILERHGVLDARRRKRLKPPPPGWFLPKAGRKIVEVDQFDYVMELYIHGGDVFHVLNGISLRGALAGSWPVTRATSENTVSNILSHWREFGLPDYAQFDNGATFYGPQQADSLGKVSRLCLSLGVTPVFVPPRELGFQAAVENFNGRWQSSVWDRFDFQNLREIQAQSERFVQRLRKKNARRIAAAPSRRAIEKNWKLDWQTPPSGIVIYIRRLDDDGCVEIMGHRWLVDAGWPNLLVRAEVDLVKNVIRFYRLRRRDPHKHLSIGYVNYTFAKRKFKEN